jgi:hypothetical protein
MPSVPYWDSRVNGLHCAVTHTRNFRQESPSMSFRMRNRSHMRPPTVRPGNDRAPDDPAGHSRRVRQKILKRRQLEHGTRQVSVAR